MSTEKPTVFDVTADVDTGEQLFTVVDLEREEQRRHIGEILLNTGATLGEVLAENAQLREEVARLKERVLDLCAERDIAQGTVRDLSRVLVPSFPSTPNHVQNLTTEDRDGNAVSPTCAYCGAAEEFCVGTRTTE